MASDIDATKPAAGAASTANVRSNFSAAKTEINELQRLTEDSVSASGTNSLTATFTEPVTLADKTTVIIRAVMANTGAVTLNVNATGVKSVVKNSDEALVANDIAGSDHYCIFKFNSSLDKWVLLNPRQIIPSSTNHNHDSDYADIAHGHDTDYLDISFREMPQNTKNANYTMVLDDSGKHIYHSNATAYTWTIPPNSSVAYPNGTVIGLANIGTGNVTIARGSGVVLRWAGDGADANRTLEQYGIATIMKVATDTWLINGAGVS